MDIEKMQEVPRTDPYFTYRAIEYIKMKTLHKPLKTRTHEQF